MSDKNAFIKRGVLIVWCSTNIWYSFDPGSHDMEATENNQGFSLKI